MVLAFYTSALIAVLATVMAITRLNPIHSLLYFITSFLATGVIFLLLGAPFVAALVVIINGGAIMVLFVFAVMILNLGPQGAYQERKWLNRRMYIGPAILAAVLLGLLFYSLFAGAGPGAVQPGQIPPGQVGLSLFGPYLIGVELASFLLLAGLLGAFHLGRRETKKEDSDAAG
jgi:NADH-quinone oxidoreductase subunit J